MVISAIGGMLFGLGSLTFSIRQELFLVVLAAFGLGFVASGFLILRWELSHWEFKHKPKPKEVK